MISIRRQDLATARWRSVGRPVDRPRCDVAFYLPSLGPMIDPHLAAPFAGGAETQVWLLARGLARRGCAVGVIVVDTPRGLPDQVDGVAIAVRPSRQPGGGSRQRAAEIRAVWRILAELRPDIVVQRTASFSTGLVGAVTRAQRGTFVYSSASVVDFGFERLASTSTELRMFHLGVRLANLIVVQTAEQAKLCAERFGRDAIVIKSIAEVARVPARRPEAFLWVGRIDPYKRPEAFLALARSVPEACFRMVGPRPGDDPELVELLSREAQALGNLELLPARPRAELLRLYETAVAVVNTTDGEGMPNTFLEGWARGVPALALAHDPDGLIAARGLGAFAAGSPERFAQAARELWAARSQSHELEQRCRDYVRREHAVEVAIEQWIAALGLSCRLRGRPPATFATPATSS